MRYTAFANIIWYLFTIQACTISAETRAKEIPFPAALEQAAITQSRLDSVTEHALILGNGDINGLLYSQSGNLVLRLTKNDVWDARLDTSEDPPLLPIRRIKELAQGDWPSGGSFGDGWLSPDGKVHQEGNSWEKPYPCPIPCAKVVLGNHPKGSAVTSRLDIRHAVAHISGTTNDAGNTTIRALAGRNVFLIESSIKSRLVVDNSGVIPAAVEGRRDNIDYLLQKVPGDLDWPGMTYAVALADEGKQKAVAIVTSHESQDVLSDALALARSALRDNTEKLIKEHKTIWHDFWTASGIEIDDDFLNKAWYRNLYFLRCVSKPDVEAVGLYAGLVQDGVPAWHGGHTTNYNAEQTFWSSFNTNHVELVQPYNRLVSEYLPRAHWLCDQLFEFDGAYFPHNLFNFEPADPQTCKSRIGRQQFYVTWSYTIGVSGFTVQNLWLRYKYQPDRGYLEKIAYPALRDVAVFYTNYIDQCEMGKNGKVILAPSVSPEHWGWTRNFTRNRNCTFDIAFAQYTLRAAIDAATILNRDRKLITRFHEALKRLPDYPITKDQKPVVVDVEDAPPITYNIAVPAIPVFPGDVVTWWSKPEEKELFARSIEKLQWNGNNSTLILAVARARLSMPDSVEWLREELAARLRPNGTFTLNRLGHHFNDNGHYTEQFAASMAIGELLLQSVEDKLRVFPAWPEDKPARFRNFRAQGGFLVSASKDERLVEQVKVLSTVGGKLRLLSPWPGIKAKRSFENESRSLEPDKDGIVTLDTKPGEVLFFLP